ncbi:MAG: ribosome maturation factor RimM [Gammaproteobacteria bacterium]|nr:ribosome maturation factor RimM [Gammaproteobacteria bacterium]
MSQVEDDLIAVGHVIGAHGVKGQIKVFSNTEPRENIVTYSPWVIQQDDKMKIYPVSGKRQGKNVIASLQGITDRDQANDLTGGSIFIRRSQLPDLAEGDFYWSQLIGLQVLSQDGFSLGRIDQMMETGANDVMVVQGDRERLIPYVMGEVILSIDLEKQRIIVDWDKDY